jgi:hypothetical protein
LLHNNFIIQKNIDPKSPAPTFGMPWDFGSIPKTTICIKQQYV